MRLLIDTSKVTFTVSREAQAKMEQGNEPGSEAGSEHGFPVVDCAARRDGG